MPVRGRRVTDEQAPVAACAQCAGVARSTEWDGEIGAWVLSCGHGMLFPGDSEVTPREESHSCSQCGWSGLGYHACPGVPGEDES